MNFSKLIDCTITKLPSVACICDKIDIDSHLKLEELNNIESWKCVNLLCTNANNFLLPKFNQIAFVILEVLDLSNNNLETIEPLSTINAPLLKDINLCIVMVI